MHLTLRFEISFVLQLIDGIVYTVCTEEEEYEYDENSGRGPSQWGNLTPEWALCSTGRMQSPVDLTNATVEIVPDSEQVYPFYQPSNTTLLNRGHDISVTTLITFFNHYIIELKFI